MKYLLSYMTMILAMIVTLLVGGGFTTVLGIAMLTFIFSTFFWEKWLEITKKTERRANVKQSKLSNWDILHY
ncbi:hypothetical protein [Staphylococcus capitis]|uniref:Phage protein n=1 Tax=Staphylococcus capitis TaxID=29388 RepID=A0ABX1SSV7_STACP|nr:hypothetical protein [Staphylococcus capitis]MBF8132015.1 hypothetical protein [Staphylococcus capitis]MCC2081237.1 hypothetical protein [Staphylococcus capitis]NMK54164.1 hypothetical protein [Staphylococcus capitis]NMK67166.1 hypothetical protein [Staphylococcus capitis]NMK69723.1 hypothetical protein [Staphylococcus capitis]